MVKELHSGGLGGDFGIDKTATLVKERYFWPSINKDVRNFLSDIGYVNWQREGVKTQVCTLHCLYLKGHGNM